jgi:hypothetical protein
VRRPARLAAALLGAGALAAGCGSVPVPAHHAAASASVPAASMNTSLASGAGTWATVVMGGSAATYNNFWQVFVQPADASPWKLVTPPGTADNGGLVLAAGTGQALITAFRPSQLLTFTPLSETDNSGQAWSAISPLDAAIAATPAAMALQPGADRLIALTSTGVAEETSAGSAAWHVLGSAQKLAATAAARRCGLRALTAAGWTPSGQPLLAGTCARPGTAGIFAYQAGTWHSVGPELPASLTRQVVTGVRLATIDDQTVALITAGGGAATSLVAAWSSDADAHWTLSAPLSLDGASPASASFGPGGTVAVITRSGTGEVISNGSDSWQSLPGLPVGTATLAPEAGGGVDALAVHAARLTVWQLAPGAVTWAAVQVINVPIEYGSSD